MLASRFFVRAASRSEPVVLASVLFRQSCNHHSLLLSFPKLCTQTLSTATGNMYAPRFPCNVGDPVLEVETPCLTICMDKFEKNMQRMAQIMEAYPGVALRPHAKAHKCVSIGRAQIQRGAVGLCCQTLSEAEAMIEGGNEDILVSNQVIGKKKTLRLAALARSAKISVCVDSEENIKDLSQAAIDLGVNLDLVVEVNVGQDRCGVEPGEDVLSLAKQILNMPGVTFKGVQCYHGSNQHVRKYTDRNANVDLVAEKSKKALQVLKDGGIECHYVTGGGTGSFQFEAASGVFTEIQPGSYIFMDADYNKNLNQAGKTSQDFEQSLYILTTVQSVTGTDRAVLDSGLKAVSVDSGVPLVSLAGGDHTFYNGGDEHGIVKPRGNLKIGDQVWLVPGHCDPTVNLHDWLVGLRNGKVECIWRVNGRGPGV